MITNVGTLRERDKVARVKGTALTRTWILALARVPCTSARIDWYWGTDSKRLPSALRLNFHPREQNVERASPRNPTCAGLALDAYSSMGSWTGKGAGYSSTAVRAASNSSRVVNPSNLALTTPLSSMMNVHGSLGRFHSVTASASRPRLRSPCISSGLS